MRKLLLLLGFIVSVTQVLAQNRTITGKITDPNGNPVANASVLIKGSSTGTTSNPDGTFTLSVPARARTLVISSVGYETREVSAEGNTVTVSLGALAREIEEVVVTGYTREKKTNFVGAASVVSGKVLENVPVASFDQMLQGRTAGLLVNSGSGQPGANATIRIRGINSIGGSSTPLYVVDGIPMEAGAFQSLNPNDFESITVLKDASAAALYGSRGGNGVVVITTKKGKAGRTNVTVRTQMGYNDFLPPTHFDLMNSEQKIQHEITNRYGPGWTYSNLNPAYANLSAANKALNDYTLDSMRKSNVDFNDVLFRKGNSQQYEVNVNGGTDKTRFYTSLNYYTQEGTDLRSELDRYTARFNVDNSTDRFSISLTNTFGFSVSSFSEGDYVGNSARNPFQISWRAMPYERPYRADGSLDFGPSTTVSPNLIGNTLEAIQNTRGRLHQLKINSGVNMAFKITPELTAKTTLGLDMRNDRGIRWINPNSYVGSLQTFLKGLHSEGNDTYTSVITTSGLTYAKTIADVHEIEVSGWFEVLRNWQRALGFTVYNLDPRLPETGQGAGSGANFPPVASSAKSGFGIRSFFGLARYTFDDRVTINGSIRRDGTSRILNVNNREITSWAVGGNWNVLKESFMDNQNIFADLRLRASYGINPNIGGIPTGTYGGIPLSSVPNFISAQVPTFATTTYEGSTITGLRPATPGNADLAIENVQKMNVGLDLGFFNNRLTATLDYYRNATKDLFVNQPLSRESGFTGADINAGTMSNNGIEISLNADLIRNSAITFSVGAAHAYNKNVIVDLGLVDQYESGTYLIKKGLPFGTHYTYNYLGADPATGQPVYETLEGGKTNDLAKAGRFAKFGTYVPKHFGGFNSNLRVKSITLAVFFSYQFDVNRSNNIESWVTRGASNYVPAVNQLAIINDLQWKKPGDVMPYQAYAYDRDFTSTDIMDASFLRLRNLSITYQMPESLTDRLKYVNNMKFYVMGQNLLIWSPWRGTDPEDNNNISLNEYPSSRMLVAGIDITF
jgi:TonB-linked SusC/RagA family outer membrane protein